MKLKQFYIDCSKLSTPQMKQAIDALGKHFDIWHKASELSGAYRYFGLDSYCFGGQYAVVFIGSSDFEDSHLVSVEEFCDYYNNAFVESANLHD